MEIYVKNDNTTVILMPLENLERLVFRNDPFYGSVNRNNLLCVDNSSLDANEEKDNIKANVPKFPKLCNSNSYIPYYALIDKQGLI